MECQVDKIPITNTHLHLFDLKNSCFFGQIMRPKSILILSKYSDVPFGLLRRLVSGFTGGFIHKLI